MTTKKDTPNHFVEWATGGGADKAAPVAGRYLTGWSSATTSDFNSDLNYILNNLCAWSKFNAKVNACEIAKKNTDFTGVAAPWAGEDTTASVAMIRYDDLAGRWYATMADTGTGANVYAYDSADGVTWNAAKQLTDDALGQYSTCFLYSNGTKVAACTSDNQSTTDTPSFWLSTDNTVANLVEHNTVLDGAVDIVHDLYWDPDSSRWFVCGEGSGGAVYLASSADGTSWTNELSDINDSARGFASDGNGTGIIVGTADVYYVTGGLTGSWTRSAAALPWAPAQVRYLPSVDAFVIMSSGSSGSVAFVKDVSAASFVDSDYDFDGIFIANDVALFEGDSGTRSLLYHWYALHNVYEDQFNSVLIEDLGRMSEQVAMDADAGGYACWDGGGSGKIIWSYGNPDKLAITSFGAPDGGA